MLLQNIDNLQPNVSSWIKNQNYLNFYDTYQDDTTKIKKFPERKYPIYNRSITNSQGGFIPNPNITTDLFKDLTGIKGHGYFINFIEPINESFPNKQKNNLRLPINIMIDIDIKSSETLDLIKKDTGIDFKSTNDAVQHIYNLLKNDNKCLYVDYSFSGNGIKAIMTFISNVYKDTFKIYDEKYKEITLILDKIKNKYTLTIKEEEELEKHKNLIDFIQLNNFQALCEYLSTFNLKYHPDSKFNYIDNCGKKPTQGTFQSQGIMTYLNPNYEVLYYEIDEKITKKYKSISKNIGNLNKNNPTISTISNSNEEYAYLFKEHFDNADIIEKARIEEFLRAKIFSHKNSLLGVPLLYSLHFITDDNILRYFFDLMIKYNAHDSSWHKVINTFDKFKADIKHMKPDLKKTRLLADIFKEILKQKTVVFDIGADFMGNKFTHEIKFDNKLSEKKTELFKIYDDNIHIIELAGAGAGKTTVKLMYIADTIKKNPDSNVVLVIPINGLLNQIKAIIKPTKDQLDKEVQTGNLPSEITLELRELYKEINIIDNYGKKHANKIPPCSLILSSTPKVSYLKNKNIKLLVCDEIQNFVNFSKEIKSDLPYKNVEKLILMSATCESYLIGEDLSKYAYIKCSQNNEIKKTLNWIRTSSLKYTLFSLIDPTRKQLIYLNNVNTSLNFINQISGVTFTLLRSNENDEHCKEVIDTQNLSRDYYFATSYINAGINFTNVQWDDVIILNNAITNPFDIYQLVNRFRKSSPKITFIRERKLNYYDKINFKDINKGINKIYKKALKKVDILNELSENHTKIISDIIKVNNVRLNNKKQYEVNIDSIKLDRLNDFFFTYYYEYDDIAYDALSYYFDIIQTEEVKDIKSIQSLSNSSLNTIWLNNWEYIIQHIDLINNIEFDNLWGIEGVNDVDIVVNDNLDFFNKKIYHIKKALDSGMDKLTAAKITFKSDKFYKNELYKFDIKRIMEADLVDNNGAETYIRQKIDEFKKEIDNAGLTKYRLKTKKIDVYKVADIVTYFQDSNTNDNYRNLDGALLFNCWSDKNVTKFLNLYVGKCFKAKINGINNIVINV
jgi:hypothetical protein